jgi:hypothetical protein
VGVSETGGSRASDAASCGLGARLSRAKEDSKRKSLGAIRDDLVHWQRPYGSQHVASHGLRGAASIAVAVTA